MPAGVTTRINSGPGIRSGAGLGLVVFLVLLLGGVPGHHRRARGDTPAAVATGEKAGPSVFTGLKGYDASGGAGKRVFEVPIDGIIDLGLAPFVGRVVEESTANDVIILRIKTFGGRVDAAVKIRDSLLNSKAPTVAFIDKRAISAGALISLACDTIIMSPGGSIGAATPVQQGEGGKMEATSEKVVSYMRAEMRATAEARGRRADIAEAMVDADIEVKGVIAKGKLLTLTSAKAVELKVADGLAANFEELVESLNLGAAERIQSSTHWAEKLARVLTEPTLSSMLMSFGFLGLLMSFYSGGFGIGGIVGLGCLALFFLGQYAANLAGMEEAILFVVGIGLLALEVLVIPGFGLAGILGIVCLGAAITMAMVELDLPWDVSWDLGYVQLAAEQALVRLAIVVVVLVVAAIVMMRYFPRSSFGSWLVFKPRTPEGKEGAVGAEAPGGSLPKKYDHLLGRSGVARTDLRPTGVAEFDGQRVHVLTEGEFYVAGDSVDVVEVDGHRVVVRKTGGTKRDGAANTESDPPHSS